MGGVVVVVVVVVLFHFWMHNQLLQWFAICVSVAFFSFSFVGSLIE